MPKQTNKDESKTPCSYRIPEALHRKLRVYCAVTGVSQNTFVNEAVEQWLQKVVKPGPLKKLLNEI